MTKSETGAETTPGNRLRWPVIIGVLLSLLGGAGGYYAVSSGLILASESMEPAKVSEVKSLPDVAFVPIDPIVVALNSRNELRHLQFRAQLEVPAKFSTEVEAIMPRVVDVLNGYLRALEARDLEDTSALTRLRGQMLRRIQIVTGRNRVNDVLIMEFVVN